MSAMKKDKTAPEQAQDLPDSALVERELNREKNKRRYRRTLLSTIFMLVTAAAAAVLVATLWMPVLQIYGSSMSPTLNEGEVVVAVKRGDVEQGDIVAVYHGNKLLVKRCIAVAGDWVTVNADGTITVNNVLTDEPYVTDHDFGESDLTYPYQVPDGRYFVVGDNRIASVDSRHTAVGCVSGEDIVGEVIFRIWPVGDIGILN